MIQKKFYIKCLCVAFVAAYAVPAAAQTPPDDPVRGKLAEVLSTSAGQVSDIRGLTNDDYVNLELPPLNVLLENARNSPTVEYFNARKEEESRALKSMQRNWLNYIKLNSSYQYGVTNYYSMYESDPNVPQIGAPTEARGLWNVGASLSIPLLELFDRRNKVKQQKVRVDQAGLEIDRWYDEQSLKIIAAYSTAVQNLRLIKSISEAVAIANAQYKVTEADFVNGKADAQTLSRQKNIQTQTMNEYLQAQAALNTALLSLEVLSKTKIINK